MDRSLHKSHLVRVCQQFNWKKYSRLNKADLKRFVNKRYKAVSTIQRWVRELLSRFKKYTAVNHDDFITLDKIQSPVVFDIKDHGKMQVFLFHPRNLLEYMLRSGQFTNPFTRQPVSDYDLKRLLMSYSKFTEETNTDPLTTTIGIYEHQLTKYTDILNMKTIITRQRADEHQLSELDRYIRERCSDIVEIILDIVMNLPYEDTEAIGDVIKEAVRYIHYHLFARFIESFRHMHILDNRRAKLYLKNILENLQIRIIACARASTKRLLCSVMKLFASYYDQIYPYAI